MPFNLKKLPDEPILFCTITDPFDYEYGPPAIFEKAGEEIGNLSGPIYWVTDLTELTLNFRNWIIMRAAAYVPSPYSVESGRMRPIYVSISNLIRTGVALENMRRAQFDSLPPIQLFETREEAFIYARQKISEEALVHV